MTETLTESRESIRIFRDGELSELDCLSITKAYISVQTFDNGLWAMTTRRLSLEPDIQTNISEFITALPKPRTFSAGDAGEARFQDSVDMSGEALESLNTRKPQTESLRKLIESVSPLLRVTVTVYSTK